MGSVTKNRGNDGRRLNLFGRSTGTEMVKNKKGGCCGNSFTFGKSFPCLFLYLISSYYCYYYYYYSSSYYYYFYYLIIQSYY